MSYLTQRFQAAVSALVGDGSVKERLVAAYAENLDDLESTEFPATLRKTFTDLQTALHLERPIGREPCVRATVRKMSAAQAQAHAGTIVMLYGELVQTGQRAEPLRVVPSGPDETPRFLSERH
jgi:hypothetical protein